METPTDLTTLDHFSDQIATTIAAAGTCAVAVDGGGRWGCSGIVWKPGIVVTADHMLSDDDAELTLPDGRKLNGLVQGRDPGTDLALVRVKDANVFSTIRPAQLEGVRVGHLSFAIARDDDNDLSASMGIVSVVGTAWHTRGGGTIDRFLRADVSLTPRFSGGPLIDAAGRVIGMNTLGLSRRMGLTVPAVVIDRIVEQLLAKGRVMRGFLGIATQSIYDGVIILLVAPRSPAERGGLLVGDVLVAADTKRIQAPDDLHALLSTEMIGRELTLHVIRGGEPREIRIVVGEC
jgi:S1-C subfamily serine protease